MPFVLGLRVLQCQFVIQLGHDPRSLNALAIDDFSRFGEFLRIHFFCRFELQQVKLKK